MAYEKNTWASGDVVTSAKLNNIENGIAGGGVLIVGTQEDGNTLDCTFREIAEAPFAVLYQSTGGSGGHEIEWLWVASYEDFSVSFVKYDGESFTYEHFGASSADGYPIYSE